MCLDETKHGGYHVEGMGPLFRFPPVRRPLDDDVERRTEETWLLYCNKHAVSPFLSVADTDETHRKRYKQLLGACRSTPTTRSVTGGWQIAGVHHNIFVVSIIVASVGEPFYFSHRTRGEEKRMTGFFLALIFFVFDKNTITRLISCTRRCNTESRKHKPNHRRD